MMCSSKEGSYLMNMPSELVFWKELSSVPLFGDNTGNLHPPSNSTYSCSRSKNIALRLLYLTKLVRDGKPSFTVFQPKSK